MLAPAGEKGKNLLEKFQATHTYNNSIVYITENVVYDKSDAILEIAKDLGRGYQFFYLFKILPKGFRNLIYDFIAKNRYSWFGKKTMCSLPSPDIKKRFL